MFVLKKNPKKDFVILNLTDTQLKDEEWEAGHKNRKILEHTISQLIERSQPDLITISGDLAWAGHDYSYKMLATFLEKFEIAWAPVWGNHDNQEGADYIEKLASEYLTYPHCIYEKGPSGIGNGNYVIAIEEDGKIIEAVIMMDSHSREDMIDSQGRVERVYSKLTEEQMEWYRAQIKMLKTQGCKDATIVLHIPIYAYNLAFKAANKGIIHFQDITLEQAEGTECWNDGYTDSIGVQHEGIGSYPKDEGIFDIIKETGLVKTIVAGHDHTNNWIIRYEGIRLVYALKTGAGCYWDPCINGGTVIKVDKNGVYKVYHEYVDVSHLL